MCPFETSKRAVLRQSQVELMRVVAQELIALLDYMIYKRKVTAVIQVWQCICVRMQCQCDHVAAGKRMDELR